MKVDVAAAAFDCRKIALGRHLDDIRLSLLIGLFRGQGLTSMAPNAPAEGRTRRVIRPLCLVTKAFLSEAAGKALRLAEAVLLLAGTLDAIAVQ